jgi:DNA-binding MarR family transcriptional regulator
MIENEDIVGPWRSLLRAQKAVIDRLEQEMESEVGLPLGWYEVLLYLEESPRGRLRMHELADSLLLSRSAATRFVDRMETADLVERVQCPADGRGLELVMTDSGRRMFREAGRVHLRGIQEHFSAHLTSEESAVIRSALTRVLEAAGMVPDADRAA